MGTVGIVSLCYKLTMMRYLMIVFVMILFNLASVLRGSPAMVLVETDDRGDIKPEQSYHGNPKPKSDNLIQEATTTDKLENGEDFNKYIRMSYANNNITAPME